VLEQFRKNYEYNYWADDLFLKALIEMPNPPAKAIELMGHLVFASDVWLARLMGEDLTRFTNPNTKGKRFEHVVQNVLVHVVNHAHYHRGQLATLVHQNGGNRPYTDYMGYALFTGESKEL
jgi:uncharacterized damage-inducible protein DinB